MPQCRAANSSSLKNNKLQDVWNIAIYNILPPSCKPSAAYSQECLLQRDWLTHVGYPSPAPWQWCLNEPGSKQMRVLTSIYICTLVKIIHAKDITISYFVMRCVNMYSYLIKPLIGLLWIISKWSSFSEILTKFMLLHLQIIVAALIYYTKLMQKRKMVSSLNRA